SNSPLCNGNSISLIASLINGVSYSWVGPNGFSSSLQNPTITNAGINASGIYSVKATLNGCTGSAGTTLVAVNPIPPTPTVSLNSPLCEGSALNLTTSAVPGASYSWTGPNGFVSSLQNPSISNISIPGAGSYSVTATVNGCTSAAGTTVAVVNPIPAPPNVGSNSPLCEGSAISLTSSSIPGASYAWSGPNGFSSTLQNPLIANSSSAQSGIYSVRATVNGCISQAASQNVLVNLISSTPLISSNSPVCTGPIIYL